MRATACATENHWNGTFESSAVTTNNHDQSQTPGTSCVLLPHEQAPGIIENGEQWLLVKPRPRHPPCNTTQYTKQSELQPVRCKRGSVLSVLHSVFNVQAISVQPLQTPRQHAKINVAVVWSRYVNVAGLP